MLYILVMYIGHVFFEQAIENVKASAAGLTRGNNVNSEPPAEVQKPRSSSTLPADFFDKQEEKRQKTGKITTKAVFLKKCIIVGFQMIRNYKLE